MSRKSGLWGTEYNWDLQPLRAEESAVKRHWKTFFAITFMACFLSLQDEITLIREWHSDDARGSRWSRFDVRKCQTHSGRRGVRACGRSGGAALHAWEMNVERREQNSLPQLNVQSFEECCPRRWARIGRTLADAQRTVNCNGKSCPAQTVRVGRLSLEGEN